MDITFLTLKELKQGGGRAEGAFHLAGSYNSVLGAVAGVNRNTSCLEGGLSRDGFWRR